MKSLSIPSMESIEAGRLSLSSISICDLDGAILYSIGLGILGFSASMGAYFGFIGLGIAIGCKVRATMPNLDAQSGFNL